MAAGTLLASYDCELADNGRRDALTEVTRLDDASFATVMLSWAYDALDRLIGETRVTGVPSTSYDDTYTYDLVGNRLGKIHTSNSQTTTVAYAYNDRDQLLTETATGTGAYSTTYGYDGNGSLTSKVRTGTDAESDAYEYDLSNRLVHVTVTDDQDNVTEYEYGYDSKGNRVLKQVTPAGGSTTTTTYLVDANNGTGYSQVYEETSYVSGGPTTVTNYLIADDVLAQSTDGQVSFLDYDGHGSTRFLTDVDGLIRSNSRYHYDAFGMAIGFDPATASTHLLYTGEQFDTGLHEYYLRARYYDPAIGQFSSFDSFEGGTSRPLSLHKYAYTHGNPVNSIDPTGQFTVLELVIVAAIIAVVCALIWWVHYWATVPPTLAGVKCTVGDLKSVSQWLKAASTNLENAKDNVAYSNLGGLLTAAGVAVVGQYGVGAVGSGGALPPGEKAIVEYFETVRWNNFHPEATMHPIGFYGNSHDGAKLWAEAEIDRISIVVKEIDAEIARRESAAGGQP